MTLGKRIKIQPAESSNRFSLTDNFVFQVTDERRLHTSQRAHTAATFENYEIPCLKPNEGGERKCVHRADVINGDRAKSVLFSVLAVFIRTQINQFDWNAASNKQGITARDYHWLGEEVGSTTEIERINQNRTHRR